MAKDKDRSAKQKEREAKAQRKLAKAQQKLREAEDLYAAVRVEGENEIQQARVRAEKRLTKAGRLVERRSDLVAMREQRLQDRMAAESKPDGVVASAEETVEILQSAAQSDPEPSSLVIPESAGVTGEPPHLEGLPEVH